MRVRVRERHLTSVFARVTFCVHSGDDTLFLLSPPRGCQQRGLPWASEAWVLDPVSERPPMYFFFLVLRTLPSRSLIAARQRLSPLAMCGHGDLWNTGRLIHASQGLLTQGPTSPPALHNLVTEGVRGLSGFASSRKRPFYLYFQIK